MPRYAWVDALGAEHDLSDPSQNWTDTNRNWMSVSGRIGFGAAPRAFSEYVIPGVPGTRNRQTVVGATDLTLQMHWDAPSVIGLRQLLRRWIGWFTLGPGELRIYDQLGNRFIGCEYASGLELDETRNGGAPNPTARRVVLTLRAFSPYFTDGHPVTLNFSPVAPASFFPILPLNLSAGIAGQGNTAINVGDVPAYPVWTFTGPGGPITVTNNTTGDTFTWTGTLDVAETVTVDTRPSALTVKFADGTSAYSGFVGDMWWLPPGTHDLTVSMLNATGASQASLTYQTLYASA